MNRRLFEGFEVGLIALCAGLWLAWRGLRNDTWRDLFGAVVGEGCYAPIGAKQFGLAEHRLDRFFPQIRRMGLYF